MLDQLKTLRLVRGAIVCLVGGSLATACSKSDDTKQPAAPAAPPATAASSAAAASQHHSSTQPGRIGPGDLLTISVSDLSGPNSAEIQPVHVADDGTVRLYYISEPLKVAGLTTSDAAEAIVNAYRKAALIQRANVHVRRLQVAADPGAGSQPIHNFDLLRISVGELSGAGTSDVWIERVDGDGGVGLSYLKGQKIAGLTEEQADRKIAAAYKSENLLANAMVSVLRLEAAPPDAEKMDLPDVAINPVPDALKSLFQLPCERGARGGLAKTAPSPTSAH